MTRHNRFKSKKSGKMHLNDQQSKREKKRFKKLNQLLNTFARLQIIPQDSLFKIVTID